MATTSAPRSAAPTPAADGVASPPRQSRAPQAAPWRRLAAPFRRWPDLWLGLLLVLIAAAPRLLLFASAPFFYFPDSTGYLEPAVDLVTGQGLTNRLKRPVGYPLLLAATFQLGGLSFMAVAAMQHVLGVLTVLATYALGRACFNRAVGFGAAVAVAVSGPQLIYEQAALTESPFILLLVLLCLALIRAQRASGYWPAVVAGLLLGVATLFRPVGQSVLPLALLFAAARPGTRRQRLIASGMLALAFSVVLVPWMARNLAQHGKFSVGGALGESLLARTLGYSRGQFVFDSPELPPDPDPRRQTTRQLIQSAVKSGASSGTVREQARVQLGLSEAESDKLLQDLTVDAIRRQPLEFLLSVADSLVAIYEIDERGLSSLWYAQRTWESHPTLAGLVRMPTAVQEAARPWAERVLGFYRPARFDLALPIAALLGLLAAWRLRPLAPAFVPGLLVFYLLLVHVTLDGPVVRYRMATEPLLNVLAFGAAAAAVGWTARGGAAPAATRSARLRRWMPAALALLLVGGLTVGLRFWNLERFDPSIFGNEYDEGIRLGQLSLMAAGYKPFREIYASQGPLLLDAFYPFFNTFGRSVWAARLPGVLASIVCVAAVFLIGRRLGGMLGGLAAALVLAITPDFLFVSRLALAEVPSMAPTVVALWLALLYRSNGRAPLLHLSAVIFALGVLFKPMAAVAAAPVLLVLLPIDPPARPGWRSLVSPRALLAAWRAGWPGWRRLWPGDLLQWCFTASAVLAVVLMAIGPSVLYEQFVAYRQGAAGLGALGHSQWTLSGNWEQVRMELEYDWALLALLAAAVPPLLLARRGLALVGLVWLAAVAALLAFYSPLAEKHVAYAFPPIALLAGGGVGAAASLLRPPRSGWRVAAAVPLGLALAWYLLTIQTTLQADLKVATPNSGTSAPERDLADTLALIERLTGPDEFVLTDHPYLAFMAGRNVPPWLVDTSRTRIRAGSLTDGDVMRQTEAFHPKVVVYWSGRLNLLRAHASWLERDYRLTRMYDRNRAVYVRADQLERVPEYVAGRFADEKARFGDLLALTDYELAAFGSGRDKRLVLNFQALRPVSSGSFVTFLELRGPDDRLVYRRDDRLLPPWHAGPLEPGQRLTHRRWFDFDGIDPGTYELLLYLTVGRGGDTLSVAAQPGTLSTGRVPGSVSLGTITLK